MTDTAQRRAERALFKKLDDGLYELREAKASHQEQEAFGVANIKLVLDIVKADARREALAEAANRLGIGDMVGLLDGPCLWCKYNGENYWQAYTHHESCPWHAIGGRMERIVAIDRLREGVEGI